MHLVRANLACDHYAKHRVQANYMTDENSEIQIDVWPESADLEIIQIAQQYRDASGVLMKLVNFVGG